MPLREEVADLLEVVWQEGIQTMVSLVPSSDFGKGSYIPDNKEPLLVGDFSVTLKSIKVL